MGAIETTRERGADSMEGVSLAGRMDDSCRTEGRMGSEEARIWEEAMMGTAEDLLGGVDLVDGEG